MATLHCRNCNTDLIPEATDCSKCQIHSPFICSKCGEPTGGLQVIGSSHPFTKDGLPLCPKDALVLCDKCHRPFEREELTLRVVRWETIASGMRVPVNGGFCPGCNAEYVEPSATEKKAGCLGAFLMLFYHQ